MHPIQDDKRPDQEPQSTSPQNNWQRYVLIVLALVVLVSFILNMSNFGDASSDIPEISFSDLRANYTSLANITFGASQATNAIVELQGQFVEPVEISIKGEQQSILRFRSTARDFQAEELNNIILTYN